MLGKSERYVQDGELRGKGARDVGQDAILLCKEVMDMVREAALLRLNSWKS